MSIYRNSCRVTERVAMKKLHAQGYSSKEISKKLRVHVPIIDQVLSGSWDSLEKEQGLVQMKLNEEKMADKRDAEANKIAQIAAAAAAAIQGQMGAATSTDTLRAEIEAQVRAEIAAESQPELTRGQKGAATRAANKAAQEQENAKEDAIQEDAHQEDEYAA